jgi:hypothetical protein
MLITHFSPHQLSPRLSISHKTAPAYWKIIEMGAITRARTLVKVCVESPRGSCLIGWSELIEGWLCWKFIEHLKWFPLSCQAQLIFDNVFGAVWLVFHSLNDGFLRGINFCKHSTQLRGSRHLINCVIQFYCKHGEFFNLVWKTTFSTFNFHWGLSLLSTRFRKHLKYYPQVHSRIAKNSISLVSPDTI